MNESKSGDSSLHDWFSKSRSSDGKPGWVQLGGKYAGKPCAKQPGQTTKPKCGSSKMKRNLSKDEEEAAFRRKNREDPNPNRKGKAKNVATEEMNLDEKCWQGYTQKGMKKKGNKVVPNCVPVGEAVEERLAEIHSSAHTPHEVPSNNLKKLVSKAVKRIDTDVDGDTDHNDKAKGELGEFIPGVGNKRLFSTTRTKTAKNSLKIKSVKEALEEQNRVQTTGQAGDPSTVTYPGGGSQRFVPGSTVIRDVDTKPKPKPKPTRSLIQRAGDAYGRSTFPAESFEIDPAAHRRQQRIEKATQLKKGTSGAESQAAGAAVKRLGGSGISLPLANSYQPEGELVDEGMTMKDFKANRRKNERRAASADAEKRGHVGKEWHNTGRKYSPDEAKSRRANMSDDDRAARHRAAVDPDDDRDENTYSADKTKNPKKLRKQKVMGEGAAWTRKEGQNKEGGLNEKGRKSYERENPGSDLKAPSKKVGNPRRKSFCARMKGMRKRQKPENNTGNDRLSKSLRAWNC